MLYKNRNSKYDILIEFKYIKKLTYEASRKRKESGKISEDIKDKKLKEAILKINKYLLDKRIDKRKLKRYIVIFVGCDYEIFTV